MEFYDKQNRPVLEAAEKGMDENQLHRFHNQLLALLGLYVSPERWAYLVESAVQGSADVLPARYIPFVSPDKAPIGEPTEDERRGMAWWERDGGAERRLWMTDTSNTGRPADAWAVYKRSLEDGR